MESEEVRLGPVTEGAAVEVRLGPVMEGEEVEE